MQLACPREFLQISWGYLCSPLALVSGSFLHHPYHLGSSLKVVGFMTLITASPLSPQDTLSGAVTYKRLEIMDRKLKLNFCITVVTVNQ